MRHFVLCCAISCCVRKTPCRTHLVEILGLDRKRNVGIRKAKQVSAHLLCARDDGMLPVDHACGHAVLTSYLVEILDLDRERVHTWRARARARVPMMATESILEGDDMVVVVVVGEGQPSVCTLAVHKLCRENEARGHAR